MRILDHFRTRLSAPRNEAISHAVVESHDAIEEKPEHSTGYVVTNIGGKTYRIESDDNYLDHIQGTFEPDMVRLFDSLIKPTDTVLDIGANIGCTSILFGSRAKKVVSFEPSPSTFQFLAKNIEAAELNNVFPQNVGLGKTAGTFELTFSTNNRSGGFVSNKLQASAGHQIEAIEVVPGDSFVRQNGIGEIDFIKIDVEGFEQDVIEGLRQTISQYKPTVTLELNHWCLNVFQRTSVPDFLDYLRSVFPYLYAVESNDIRNLHNVDEAYHVMYYHVVGGFKYPNIVGAHHASQLEKFGADFGRSIT
ncbi:FkbM family methyltransferase [Massilia horti]|uniref:FkbM family methyltransferase n=1 Tax=Massilia horti TaxID=2562153 RepID=A0A4Y9SZ64_9BURK|nr:FkbM family methyltransferase [Massilia horti]TFW31949.1 FkbM family methyltransferase [Massilia horti]